MSIDPTATTMTTPMTMTLRLLRDDQAVRDLGYRFADACNRDDGTDFRQLWADDAVWIIDHPFNLRTESADAIETTRSRLRSAWDFFVQMPHAPVIRIEGNRATSTWTVSEHAINIAEGRTYFNYARYDDTLIKTADGWRYLSRHYRYYHLDQTPSHTSAVPIPSRRGPGIH
jgi:hypothetical protein